MFKKGLMAAAMICMLSMATVMCAQAEEAQTETEAAETTEAAGEAEAAASGQAEFTWDENLQQMFINDGFAGTIFDIDALGMEILVPEGMEKRQPTDEEKAKDTILVFENTETEQKIELVLGEVGECKTLDEVKAYIEENVPGIVITPTRINEYDTLVYGSEETNSMCVLIGAGDAGFLRVICRPIDTPEMNSLFSYVAASIQQIKD